LPGELREDALGQAATPGQPAWRRRRWRRRRRSLAAVLMLPWLGVALGFLWFLHVAAATPAEPIRRTDGIVVLTGGAERVRTGLALLAGGHAGCLLVSGAHPDVTLAALAASAGQTLDGLPPCVTLGRSARSTHGNAVETAAWARAHGLESIRLVTAGYHMPRAALELRRLLPSGVAVIPHPVQPPALREAGAAGRGRTWSLLLGEYAKLIGAWLGLGAAQGAMP
jgi:uncharacterized SAM-binding protein YcdF (DUF218 family)